MFCLPFMFKAAASVSSVSRERLEVDLRREGRVTDSMAVENRAETCHGELRSRVMYGGSVDGGERGM